MLGGDDLGQFRRSLGGELPEGEQQLGSLSERRVPPGRERARGGGDRLVDFGGGCESDLFRDLSGRGVVDVADALGGSRRGTCPRSSGSRGEARSQRGLSWSDSPPSSRRYQQCQPESGRVPVTESEAGARRRLVQGASDDPPPDDDVVGQRPRQHTEQLVVRGRPAHDQYLSRVRAHQTESPLQVRGQHGFLEPQPQRLAIRPGAWRRSKARSPAGPGTASMPVAAGAAGRSRKPRVPSSAS